jgi:mannose-6-phosphate isomerase
MAATLKSPFLVQPWFSPRLWGSLDLRAWYPERAPEAEPIGEAWLTADASPTSLPGAPPLSRLVHDHRQDLLGSQAVYWKDDAFPLLVKLLFPCQRLSVQVHPDDAYAAAHALGRGKTEMWHVLEAAPGASLGVNLKRGVSLADFAAACRAGRGADALNWIPVQAGDTIYLPAGTIHAIGPDMVLAEVQQQSDNTFRLDDYGRLDVQGQPRELHLEAGLQVARAHAGGGQLNREPQSSGLLAASAYFRVEKIALAPGDTYAPSPRRVHVFVLLQGAAALAPIAADEDPEATRIFDPPPAAVAPAPLALPLAHAAILPAAASRWHLTGPATVLDITLP